jgi:glycoside/pentoside/hexuronide:cation symporter, GPH family
MAFSHSPGTTIEKRYGMAAAHLTIGQRIAYTALIVPMSLLHSPALSILPALYAKHTAIGVATVGLVLTLTRLFDVVIDPAIGYLSDNTKSRWGRRKPWVVLGAILSMVSVYFWFRPGPQTDVWYFLFASLAVYLGWTLVEIPHTAWFSELAQDYDERSRISGLRTAATYIGMLVFLAIPLLPIFPTTEMTPQVTAFASWLVMAAIPITAAAAVIFVPNGRAPPTVRIGVGEVLRAMARNGPLRNLTVVFGLSFFSSGMCGALYFFYIDAYLGILDKLAYVGLVTTIIGLAATFVWPAIIEKIGKHRALALTMFSMVATLVAMGLIRPGHHAFEALMAVFALSAILSTGSTIALTTLMADAVDYDEWKTGTNKAGNFFAISTIYQKVGSALGGGVAFVIVGLFGFNPAGHNGAFALTGFFLTFLGLPVLINLVAAFTALKFPITKRAQQAIRRRLDRRASRGNPTSVEAS